MLRPLVFTLGVTGLSFYLADLAIKYNTKAVVKFTPPPSAIPTITPIQYSVDPNQLTLNGLIALNALVYLGFNLFPGFFHTHFAQSAFSGKVYPMFTSMFAHQNLWHIIFNMITLHSLAPVVQQYLGNEHFLSFYVSSGMIANLFSHYYHVFSRQLSYSLGASGAILGILGMSSMLIPHAGVLLFFVIPLKMQTIPLFVACFDIVGLTGFWSRLIGFAFDHAAHLGGLGFGLLSTYTYYSPRHVYNWRNPRIPFLTKVNRFVQYQINQSTHKF